MKQELLNEQMIRYHSITKPRHYNPTFLSTNVAPTFGSPQLYRSQSLKTYLPPVNSVKSNQQDNAAMPKFTPNKANIEVKQKGKVTPPSSRRSQNSLMNFGMKSLGSINPYITDKGVYEKQSKKYNIITIQPKEFLDSIRIFPKLRLQDQDAHYLKRQLAATQLTSKLNFFNKKTQNGAFPDKQANQNPQKLDIEK